MIIEAELRAEIARTLAGESSLPHLYRWVMDRTWNMHKDTTAAAINLAIDVECVFFERTNESDAEVLAELRRTVEGC